MKQRHHYFWPVIAVGLLILAPLHHGLATDRVVATVANSVGQDIGRLTLTDLPDGGIHIDPLVQGLPPGEHAMVVASTGSCRLREDRADLYHPLTSGVYDAADEQGRLQVNDGQPKRALEHRRDVFLERMKTQENQVARDGETPIAPQYTQTDTELALGNLPSLFADRYGNATQIAFAPKITVAQLYGRSIHIRVARADTGANYLGCAAIGFPTRP